MADAEELLDPLRHAQDDAGIALDSVGLAQHLASMSAIIRKALITQAWRTMAIM